jgi:hypothetical protein
MAKKKNDKIKTPEELKKIREMGGVGDSPIKRRVPSREYNKDLQRRVQEKREADKKEETSFPKVDIAGVGEIRLAGEEKGPSAAPKPKIKGPLVTPGKKLRQRGMRPATTREIKRGVMAVTLDKPVKKKRVAKKTTRTGKKLNAEGQISKPKIGQIAKIGGKLAKVDSSNVDQAIKEKVTTVLPTVGPEKERPRYELPTGRDALQGFSTANSEDHARLKSHVNEAWGHLGRMVRTHGTEDFNTHHTNFNEVHAKIAAYDHSLGTILGIAHHAVLNPHHPDSAKALTMAKQASGDRIKLGMDAASGRTASQKKARDERMARIRSEREGN